MMIVNKRGTDDEATWDLDQSIAAIWYSVGSIVSGPQNRLWLCCGSHRHD